MKIWMTIIFLLAHIFAIAETTTDRLVVSNVELLPGGEEVEVTLSLEGSRLYTGYQMDITLPEGVRLNIYEGNPDVSMNKDADCVYPFTGRDKVYSHSVSTTYNEVGTNVIRIACNSNKNENFTSTSGKLLTMYLKATTFAKPGAINLALSNCKLATYNSETMETTGYVPEQTTISGITVGTQAKATLSVSSSNKWGTLMLPFSVLLPQGVMAYSCSSNNADNLILSPVESIEAFTPYIIYSEEGYSGELSGTVSAETFPTSVITEDYLCSSVTEQTITDGYVLQKQNDVVKFYKVNPETPVTIPAGKCWVVLPQSHTAKEAFGFSFNTSTINNAPFQDNQSATIYTLSGVKVDKKTKGAIYIQNGKKIIQ